VAPASGSGSASARSGSGSASAAPASAPAPRRLLVATRSRHKLRELGELLALAPGVELLSPDDLGIEGEPDETGKTFETNARIKARYYARRSGLPTLADDSGLEVDALNGAPGVCTRRFAGPDATDEQNNQKLLRDLAGLPPERRGGRYVCVLALALPEEGSEGRGDGGGGEGGEGVDGVPSRALNIVVRRGTCRGRIAGGPRGEGGFGYDPIFEPAQEPPGGRTLGQWSAAEKHAISHRSRAAARMRPLLAEHGLAG
jgi:XTP/dITP diphosphohydrolase